MPKCQEIDMLQLSQEFQGTQLAIEQAILKAKQDGLDFDEDALREALLNKEIEISIREQPERYLWIHRRFKHRPKDDLEIYDRSLMRKKR